MYMYSQKLARIWWIPWDFLWSIEKAANVISCSSLKNEQKLSIAAFLNGRVVLPTWFSKTTCYNCLPLAVDLYHKLESDTSIIIVISPLMS